MKTIKLIAIDIDGILLEDTFSPIMYNFVSNLGIKYTGILERNIFSRPQKEAANYIGKSIGKSAEELIHSYFEERDKYIRIHGCNVNEGVPELLELLANLNIRLVYYGGLSEDKITSNINKYKCYFERYICTNNFRPGIKEITKDMYGLEYSQILFIDDVNFVAEVAKMNNVPFIGIPSNFPWGFQKQDMIKTNVKYLLNSIREINLELLERIDFESFMGTIWKSNIIKNVV
jgi:phosphoglycolate phosphatase-like HAD superfamily hydrolase